MSWSIILLLWCSSSHSSEIHQRILYNTIFDSTSRLAADCTYRLIGNHNNDFVKRLKDTPVVQFSLQPKTVARVTEVSRHSSACAITTVFIDGILHTTDNNLLFELLNSHRHGTMYTVFVAKETDLENIFSIPTVQRLKYALGIAMDSLKFYSDFQNGHLMFHDRMSWENFPRNWRCLQNRHLKIGAFRNPGRFVLDPISGKPLNGLGSYKIFIEQLQRFYNLSIDLQLGFEKIDELNNGTLVGFAGEVANYSKDAVFSLAQLDSRYKRADFTNCLVRVSFQFFMSLPKYSITWKAIFHPFDMKVWILVLASITILVPVLYVKFRLDGQHKNSIDNWFHACRLVFHAVLQQGSVTAPKMGILMTPLLFYGMVLGVCYNSKLLSFITALIPEEIPKTFQELALREDYNIYGLFYDGSSERLLFNSSKDTIFQRIGQRMRNKKTFFDCVASVFNEPKGVCMGWDSQIRCFVAKNFTIASSFYPLKVSPSSLEVCSQGLLQKNSKYLSDFNLFIAATFETGLMKHWHELTEMYLTKMGREWILSQNRSTFFERLQSDLLHSKNDTIQLKHILPVVMMVVVFQCLGALSFIAELFSPLMANTAP
ncbi:unnamed protein product [Allacma fusca]|uniref:Ionotropic receptor n=2 Tax=Allacma fusca TaxID=39272 RepID=A0A8J2JAT1_9HEXA|nr:unnamed protein product [Allacma fusca]